MKYLCSKCKETIPLDVYDYSMKKYGKPLCRNHQKKDSEPNDGLSKKETNYKEGMIKGRIAETLIEELFLSLGYSIFRYGMENTVPGVMNLLKGIRSDVAQNIRRMPDFVVQDKKGEVYFVEVKFRANGEFKFKDLPKDYPFKNCYFIIVSKKHIKCINYEELEQGKEVSPKSKNYLGNRKEFELNKNVIIQFCEFAVTFFKDV